jgi:hypothetical protein
MPNQNCYPSSTITSLGKLLKRSSFRDKYKMHCLPLSSKTNQTLKLLFSRIQIQQYNLKIEDTNAALNQLIVSTNTKKHFLVIRYQNLQVQYCSSSKKKLKIQLLNLYHQVIKL